MSGDGSRATRVVFLGGLGEIGRNMIAVETQGKILVIDTGLSFPNDEMLGVDLVLPDFTYVSERAEDCVGVVLTHGHEDHVGALSWFLQEVDVPVYGTPLTLGMARKRLDESGQSAEMIEISAPGSREIGPFRCSFLAVSHSIPDAVSVAIDTADGRIVYTGDFKLDDAPIDGRHTDLEGFRRLGDEGVDLLLSDSTNAETPGRTPSESLVGNGLRDLFSEAKGRVVVACFASNLHRIQQVCEAAEATGRHVAFIGRSMINNFEVGRELGHIRVGSSTVVDIEAIEQLPPSKVAVISTGSQGEPFSALALISAGDHKFVTAGKGDTVILSASPIPGNESAVHRVINGLYKAGADVYDSSMSPVHVSGHAASEELAEMIRTVRPRHFTPVHGEFRHLSLHKRIAEANGVSSDVINIVEDGDVLVLDTGKVRRGQSVQAGMVLVDGLGVGDVGPVVLRDRRVLAGDGILVCVVTIDQHGELMSQPDLISRGFVYEQQSRDLLSEASELVARAVESLEDDQVTDRDTVKKACRRALGEFVWRSTHRRPMLLPVVIEV